MKKSFLPIVSALFMLAASFAQAAPFCSVTVYGKQCWYHSMKACQQSGNYCIVNPDEVKVPRSGAPFCVVHSYGTNCWYYDAQSCQRAAQGMGGACVYAGR